jgi:xanthine dehydrogenase accessory factor
MDVFGLMRELVEAEEPFVLATVVRCEPPASARPGAKAVIRADGSMEGWVGGSCAQPLVVEEARRALRDGRPHLVRLGPTIGETGSGRPDVAEYLMTCHSGGTLEIFVEPVVPRPRLCLVGDTPVARTLAALGKALGYRVARIEPTADIGAGGRTCVVIATMGAADEEALEAALRSPAPYVALVASPRRAEILRDYLLARGVTPEQLARLRAPAGLDIGAETQEEIALSIMAEIVQSRSTAALEAPAEVEPAVVEAKDPVCGMSVSTQDARFRTDHAGTTYYFCCAHCKSRFEAEPLLFAAVSD